MIKVRTLLVISCMFLFLASPMVAQEGGIIKRKTGGEQPYYKNKWYFGISLTTTYTGFVRYGVIKVHEDGRKEIAWLTKEGFIRQVTGQAESKANPDRQNLMETNEIRWEVFDQLWKVRYSEYPYQTTQSMEPGWAGKMFCPSDAQWTFLKQNYGYSNFNDMLFGDNLWKFLKDAQDPAWAAQYSSLK